MQINTEAAVLSQRRALQAGQPQLQVLRPCKVGDGIIAHSEEQKETYRSIGSQLKKDLHFFIPASGSGSRMFAFLEAYSSYPSAELHEQVVRLMSRLPEFALFRKLPLTAQEAYFSGQLSIEILTEILLSVKGLHYADFPKALIPFHLHEPLVLNAFQEHLIQSEALAKGQIHFHFTIQEEFQTAFDQQIAALSALTAKSYEVRFSSQDKATDAFVFDQDFNVVQNATGEPMRRPAGHGTLLKNLQALEAEYILVKNIDNVQHYSQKGASVMHWQYLLGVQVELRKELKSFLELKDWQGLALWNQKWQLFDNATLAELNDNELLLLLNRPLRVCGMVRNNGQPGGGPFYMELNGKATKQIIEKVQLAQHANAGQLLLQSAYFNPVFMVLSPCDLQGKAHDLSAFADPNSFLIVEKNQGGQSVQFIEQPGLWNGAMAHWNTLFVELPNDVFSPVKTVLDLLDFAHQANKGG